MHNLSDPNASVLQPFSNHGTLFVFEKTCGTPRKKLSKVKLFYRKTLKLFTLFFLLTVIK